MIRFLCFFSFIFFASSGLFALGSDDAMNISKSGMMAQKEALKYAAENVANATTLKTENGQPYQKKYPVLVSTEDGVKVVGYQVSKEPFKRAYDPGNPLADKNGFILLPNVNMAEEMTQISMANIYYEANTTAYKSAKAMFQQSMEILK